MFGRVALLMTVALSSNARGHFYAKGTLHRERSSALEARQDQAWPVQRIKAGRLLLVVGEDTIRAYDRKTPNKEKWRLTGMFVTPVLAINGGHNILVSGVPLGEYSGLACVNQEGKMLWSDQDQSVIAVTASPRYVVYSSHSGTYRERDNRDLDGKLEDWKVTARRLSDGKLLWTRPQPRIGEPCAITGFSELWTIRNVNLTDHYIRGKPPVYHFELRDALTSRLRHAWILPMAKSKYNQWPGLAHAIDHRSVVGFSIWEGTYKLPFPDGIVLRATYERRKNRIRGTLNRTPVKLKRVM